MAALTWAFIAHLAAQPACTVPGMVPEFWPAVVQGESSYDPLALHDDTASRAYYPDSAEASEAIATRLMTAGHSVGVGLSQLTASSPQEFLSKFGLTIREALDPCRNMQAGTRFYVDRALRIYNTGSPTKGAAYAARVAAALQPGAKAVPQSGSKVIPVAVNRHAADTEVWQ